MKRDRDNKDADRMNVGGPFMVRLATFMEPAEASILKGVLKNEGIRSFVLNKTVSSVLNISGNEIEIVVYQEDYERALKIFKEGFPELNRERLAKSEKESGRKKEPKTEKSEVPQVIRLATFMEPAQASILKGALKNEGIKSFVLNKTVSSVLNISGNEIEIVVYREDYERALKIFKEGFPELNEE